MRSSRLFASAALLSLLASLPDAIACGWSPEDLSPFTTFDPAVAGEPDPNIYYNPYAPFSGCEECVRKQVIGEWSAWLGPQVKKEDWERALYKASLDEIDALIFHLQGKKPWPEPAKSGWPSVLAATGETKSRLISALYFVGFARRVEPFAQHGDLYEWVDERKHTPKPDEAAGPGLQKNGEGALGRATDPFLKQRYALQLVRLRFHRRDHAGVVSFVKDNAATLDAPSESTRGMARRYLAGSLAHVGKGADAVIELGRVFSSAPALSGSIATDLQWVRSEDWERARKTAKGADAVGVRALLALQDGFAGMSEVAKLDPASKLLPLLAVREIERVQSSRTDVKPLEALAVQIAGARGADRPWVQWLVAGHAAALRADLAATRERVDRARKLRPSDPRVAAQANASIALAIAGQKTTTPRLEDECLAAMAAIPDDFGRRDTTVSNVLSTLRASLTSTRRAVDAELILPTPPYQRHYLGDAFLPWPDAAFVKELRARIQNPKTSLDRYAVQKHGITVASIDRELAFVHVRNGDYAAALKLLPKTGQASLEVDPFVMNFRDCYYCPDPGEKLDWTHATLIARLQKLQTESKGTGEPAAKASLELANALYNLTTWGNATHFWNDTRSASNDTAAAVAMYERARSLSKDRELQAKAAFGLARCELAGQLAVEKANGRTWYDERPLPVPARSFTLVKSYADTKFHEEILAECSHYASWSVP